MEFHQLNSSSSSLWFPELLRFLWLVIVDPFDGVSQCPGTWAHSVDVSAES